MLTWYVIAQDGAHSVPMSHPMAAHEWPEFTQLALRVDSDTAFLLVEAFLSQHELLSEDSTPQSHFIHITQQGEWALLAEPGIDVDARVLQQELVEAMIELFALDAIFIANDDASNLLQLDVFEAGQPVLRWQDATDPMIESIALTFHDEGRCTFEDARAFALRALELPEDTPVLDRYSFIEFMLHHRALHTLAPQLEGLPITHALRVAQR